MASSNATPGNKTPKSKNWPKILPRSRKHHNQPSSSNSNTSSSGVKPTMTQQYSSESPPPRPPPPLSRKGSTANERTSHDFPSPKEELTPPSPMDPPKA